MRRAAAAALFFGIASCASAPPIPCGCLPPEEEPAAEPAALLRDAPARAAAAAHRPTNDVTFGIRRAAPAYEALS